MSRGGLRLNGPLVGLGIIGVVAASYIAYYLYRRSRRRRLMNYLKRIYNHDHELYDEADEEPYSDEDDFYVDNNVYEQANKEAVEPTPRRREKLLNFMKQHSFRVARRNVTHEATDTVENIESLGRPKDSKSDVGLTLRSRNSKFMIPKQQGSPQDEDWESVDGSDGLTDCGDKHLLGINASAILEAADSNQGSGCTVPERQSVYFKGFGCAHNMSDSEYMKGLLSEYGYALTDVLEDANVAVINSCTVKGPSQDAMSMEIQRARSLNIPVVVGGCVSQADRSLGVFQDSGVSLLGVQQVDKVVDVVEQTLKNRKVMLLDRKVLPSLNLPKIRQNKLIEIIPISTGCLGACTFCKTKHARGVLGSYSMEAILDRVEAVVAEGVQQIWLTSEDTGAYGIDIGTNIVTLLRGITALLPEGVMLRLGMSNPPYIKRHIADVVEILKHDNVFEFLHLPVQSGSDRVLDLMNREYHITDFEYLVEHVRKSVPECTLATDIICGFPTETEEDHRATLSLIDKYRFPVVNISQFYPRPGTGAAKMKPHENKVTKSRTREVTQLFMSYECNSSYLNRTLPVWFSDIDVSHNQTVGHTKSYVKVVVPLDPELLGKRVLVQIVETTKWHLLGIVFK
ncbi:CDK5 regulatory subunit-associated protein [Babesia divergens]|uniref:Threonylcarbamoyladenosine tRNA methylthiotransferase n=1 Tax=Babesia divergens TaxID=32595 RepID=A0AAD9G6T0_BABDI|nr:CDK5 regulatory subunit-associated protein [Babesia divergens]